MIVRHDRSGCWVLGLEPGEPFRQSLEDWARREGVTGASLNGIGGIADPVLGFWRGTAGYEQQCLKGNWELLNLQGNLSIRQGRPFLHAHVMLAGSDLACRGGHFFEGHAAPCAELFVQPLEEPLIRGYNPTLGAALWIHPEVLLHDPQPDWESHFQELKLELEQALGNDLLQCHWIGSTAIPGIRAKDLLDVLPVVTSVEAVQQRLTQLGFEYWGEYGLAGRGFFLSFGPRRRVHLHAYPSDHPDIARHLGFRDYLRNHPDRAREYEATKDRCARLHPQHMQAYNQCKGDCIRQLESEAQSHT